MQIDSLTPLTSSASRALHNDAGVGLPVPAITPNTAECPPAPGTGGKSFGQCLQDAVSDVNDAQLKAADVTARYAAGEPMDVHQVMLASQEASVSLQMAMQVRNKIVDAYQELQRISL